MKIYSKLLILALLALLFLPSCDESEPFEYERQMVKKDYAYSYTIVDSGGTMRKDSVFNKHITPISLYNILDKDIADKLTQADLIECSMQIVGLDSLQNDVVLKDFALHLNDGKESYRFGDIDKSKFADGKTIQNNVIDNFIEQLLDYFDQKNNKSPILTLTFTNDEEIVVAEKKQLNLIIAFQATYHYIKVK